MNTGFILGCGFLAAISAQFPIIRNTYFYEVPIHTDTLVNPGNNNLLRLGNISGATFSHNTSKGKIFLLSPDKTPCLVPDPKSLSRMPVYRPKMRFFRMPNTLPTDTADRDKKFP